MLPPLEPRVVGPVVLVRGAGGRSADVVLVREVPGRSKLLVVLPRDAMGSSEEERGEVVVLEVVARSRYRLPPAPPAPSASAPPPRCC